MVKRRGGVHVGHAQQASARSVVVGSGGGGGGGGVVVVDQHVLGQILYVQRTLQQSREKATQHVQRV